MKNSDFNLTVKSQSVQFITTANSITKLLVIENEPIHRNYVRKDMDDMQIEISPKKETCLYQVNLHGEPLNFKGYNMHVKNIDFVQIKNEIFVKVYEDQYWIEEELYYKVIV